MMDTTQYLEKADNRDRIKADVSADISKIGVYAIAISAGLIGCWATVCLVAGIVTNGGPVELVKSLFSAIVGS